MAVANSAIEWTDATWNPVTGCSKVSPGCAHCYAETVAARFWPQQYVHTVERGFISVKHYDGDRMDGKPRAFTDVMCHEDRVGQPLRWRKPRRVFVNSMSDLFHKDVPDAFIVRVFNTMALTPRHTFQILTKRPERMRALVPTLAAQHTARDGSGWPLANVWLGVSVENQHFADERIPLLLQTPAAVRFISYEPALGPIDLRLRRHDATTAKPKDLPRLWRGLHADEGASAVRSQAVQEVADSVPEPRRAGSEAHASLDWVIVGGESGPGARPFDLAWARSIVQQCQAAGVPVFVKQLGANPTSDDRAADLPRTASGITRGWRRDSPDIGFRDRKGGDMDEWPTDLRVRQFPEARCRN